MSLKSINQRILKEICYDTIYKLKDINLIDNYKETKSLNIKLNNLSKILSQYITDDKIKDSIMNDMICDLTPSTTKSIIKDHQFNYIVNQKIDSFNLDKKQFRIHYDTHYNSNLIYEKPDWYIIDNYDNKVLIGMNQLDIWSGGYQKNRGFNYLYKYDTILSKCNNTKVKLICVVCNEIKLKSNKNRIYQLFNKGFTNNTLCYLNNLDNIIHDYFKIKK